jgi:hypothetical protein
LAVLLPRYHCQQQRSNNRATSCLDAPGRPCIVCTLHTSVRKYTTGIRPEIITNCSRGPRSCTPCCRSSKSLVAKLTAMAPDIRLLSFMASIFSGFAVLACFVAAIEFAIAWRGACVHSGMLTIVGSMNLLRGGRRSWKTWSLYRGYRLRQVRRCKRMIMLGEERIQTCSHMLE